MGMGEDIEGRCLAKASDPSTCTPHFHSLFSLHFDTKMARVIAGFTVLAIAYSPSSTHYLYARPHVGSKKNGSQSTLPEGRTLFLVNVPPDASERELVLFFKYAGTAERVVFPDDATEEEPQDDPMLSDSGLEDDAMEVEEIQPRKKRKLAKEEKLPPPKVIPLPTTSLRTLRRSGRTAHLVFLDASSLTRALQPSATQKPRPWPSSPNEPLGLDYYLAQHSAQRPPLDVVRAHADSFMARFDWEQARARRHTRFRKGEAIVDEDGFTLVTRGGAYGQTLGGGVGVASRKFQEAAAKGAVDGKRGKGRKKREAKAKEGFYAFQVHEKKRNGMCCLLQR